MPHLYSRATVPAAGGFKMIRTSFYNLVRQSNIYTSNATIDIRDGGGGGGFQCKHSGKIGRNSGKYLGDRLFVFSIIYLFIYLFMYLFIHILIPYAYGCHRYLHLICHQHKTNMHKSMSSEDTTLRTLCFIALTNNQ